jgi:hypothetical protein
MTEKVEGRLRKWAESPTKHSSPLYSHLAHCSADEPDLLRWAAKTPETQPLPHLLFGAIQFLLMQEGREIKATDNPATAYRKFRTTVFDRSDEVDNLLDRMVGLRTQAGG